jgi:hypothetical protein
MVGGVRPLEKAKRDALLPGGKPWAIEASPPYSDVSRASRLTCASDMFACRIKVEHAA